MQPIPHGCTNQSSINDKIKVVNEKIKAENEKLKAEGSDAIQK
jgi:hypothetical protein